MAHRKPLIDQANDLSAMAMEQCRMERVSERVLRLQGAQLLTSEFAEMNAHIQDSLSRHGEVTPRVWRSTLENLRDLCTTLRVPQMDMPRPEADTSVAAD